MRTQIDMTKQKQLLDSAASGDQETLVRLLDEGQVDPNMLIMQSSGESYNPLHAAVENGHIEVVKILIKKGANPLVECKCTESRSHPSSSGRSGNKDFNAMDIALFNYNIPMLEALLQSHHINKASHIPKTEVIGMKSHVAGSTEYRLANNRLAMYREILASTSQITHNFLQHLLTKRMNIEIEIKTFADPRKSPKPLSKADQDSWIDIAATLCVRAPEESTAPRSRKAKKRSHVMPGRMTQHTIRSNNDASDTNEGFTEDKSGLLSPAERISNELKSSHDYDLLQRTPVFPGPSQAADRMTHFASKASGIKGLRIGRYEASSVTSKRHIKKKNIKGKSGILDSEKDEALEFIAQQNIEDYMLPCQSASINGIGIDELVKFPKTEYLKVLRNIGAEINELKNAFGEREKDREGPYLKLGEKILLKALNQQLQHYLAVFLHALPVAEDLGKEIAINEEQRLDLTKYTIDLIVCLDRVDEKHNRSIIPQIFTAFRGEGALEKAQEVVGYLHEKWKSYGRQEGVNALFPEVEVGIDSRKGVTSTVKKKYSSIFKVPCCKDKNTDSQIPIVSAISELSVHYAELGASDKAKEISAEILKMMYDMRAYDDLDEAIDKVDAEGKSYSTAIRTELEALKASIENNDIPNRLNSLSFNTLSLLKSLRLPGITLRDVKTLAKNPRALRDACQENLNDIKAELDDNPQHVKLIGRVRKIEKSLEIIDKSELRIKFIEYCIDKLQTIKEEQSLAEERYKSLRTPSLVAGKGKNRSFFEMEEHARQMSTQISAIGLSANEYEEHYLSSPTETGLSLSSLFDLKCIVEKTEEYKISEELYANSAVAPPGFQLIAPEEGHARTMRKRRAEMHPEEPQKIERPEGPLPWVDKTAASPSAAKQIKYK